MVTTSISQGHLRSQIFTKSSRNFEKVPVCHKGDKRSLPHLNYGYLFSVDSRNIIRKTAFLMLKCAKILKNDWKELINYCRIYKRSPEPAICHTSFENRCSGRQDIIEVSFNISLQENLYLSYYHTFMSDKTAGS